MPFNIFWMNVAAVFAILNVVLVGVLLSLYLGSWKKFRSSITLALVLFASFFLIQNLVIIVFWYVLYGLVPQAQAIVIAAAPYLVAVNATETIALANLVRVTLA